MSILISMLLLGSATIANLSYAIDNTHKDFNHIIQQADKPKIQNSIRLSNSINYYTPAPRNERLGGDAYEWNNNTDTAVNLNPDYYYTGSYSGTFHSRITNLTLDTYGYIHDYDYFYFKLLFESNVSVSLVGNSSNYCSFDFFLMQFEYQRINFSYSGNSKANRNLTNIIENVSNDITKSYSGILKPGTYYILSRCKNTQPYGVDITYGLTLDVIKRTATRSNVEITDLKFNRNLGAAVWLADYLPLGFSNIFRPYIIADFYNSQTNGINVEDYALNDLMYIVSSGDYKVAEFYIWDPYIKVALSQVIDETINIVEAEIDNNSKINNQINTTINLIDKTITVACTIVSAAGNLTPYSVAISVASTIINKVSHYFLKFLLNTYLKTNIQTASQYLYYLSKVNSALAVQYTDETKTTVAPEFLTSFSTVALPCFCKFSSSGNSLIPTSFTRTISFDNSKNNLLEDTFQFNGDVISHDQTGTAFIDGDIYGITSDMDILNPISAFQKATSYPYISPYVENLSLVTACAISNLHKNEYRWYKFVANENSDYSFYTAEFDSSTSTDSFVYGSIIEVFSQVVNGHSIVGRIKKVDGGFYDESGVQRGSYYQKHMQLGEILYFRISCGNIGFLKHAIAFNARNYYLTYLPHTHDYTDNYVRESMTKHKSYCSCLAYILEGHVVPSGGTGFRKYCLICGGEAVGIVGPLSLTTITNYFGYTFFGNGSYIYNSIAYLSDEDITLFEMGLLYIPWL